MSNQASLSNEHYIRILSIAVSIMAVLAVLYTLNFARAFLLPFAISVLLYLLLTPMVQRLKKIGVPYSLSSATILITLLVGLSLAGNYLFNPAREWLREAPTSLRQLAREVDDVKAPLEEVKVLGEQVDEITKLQTRKPKTQEVEIKDPSRLDKLVKGIPPFLASVAVVFLIAFFLLSSGDVLGRRIVGFGRSWRTKSQIIRVCRQVQEEVSRHLRTITFINLGLGVVVGVALYFLGVPNAALWAAMVALLNFAPYAGAIVSALVLAVVGLTSTDTLTQALMVPGVFLVLTSLEGAVITPLVLGNRLNLSPLAVFLSVVFWGWLWGIAGALIAVPMMSSIQVVLANFETTQPMARLMRGR